MFNLWRNKTKKWNNSKICLKMGKPKHFKTLATPSIVQVLVVLASPRNFIRNAEFQAPT